MLTKKLSYNRRRPYRLQHTDSYSALEVQCIYFVVVVNKMLHYSMRLLSILVYGIKVSIHTASRISRVASFIGLGFMVSRVTVRVSHVYSRIYMEWQYTWLQAWLAMWHSPSICSSLKLLLFFSLLDSLLMMQCHSTYVVFFFHDMLCPSFSRQ